MSEEMKPIIFGRGNGFLPGYEAAVVVKSAGMNIFETPTAAPISVTTKDEKEYKVVPWGDSNTLPSEIVTKVQTSPDLSSGMLFNIQATFGDGIMPCRISYDEKGEKKVVPVMDNKEINSFFEYNDINGFLIEQITDLSYFYNIFPEIILNRDTGNNRKVVELNHKEAAFSRWSEMNEKTGKIEYHLYNADWGTKNDNIEVTPVLDSRRPVYDLLERMGRSPRSNGTFKDDRQFRYIVPVNFPTPGRTYYQRPYWYSIIESGWYDFAIQIPKFKKYVLENGMTIKYIIYLSDDYFPDIFAREGLTTEAAQKDRIALEYTNFNTYLTGMENQGKSMISFTKTSPDGKKEYRVEIKAVENNFKGGEYLDDSSEVSNMIAYSLGVHPSLIGASPGKTGGSMSGTDKRELYIIKQSLLKPIRDRLLKPLYLIKIINRWPEDIHFVIPNIELTTLDKNKSGIEEKV
jgi:hypothetical protein